MIKDKYLDTAFRQINELITDGLFRNNLAQVRARASQTELLPDLPNTGFRFDPKRIWLYCDYIFSEGALLLRKGSGDRKTILNWIKTAAETFEFLSRFAEEGEKELLLLNSAMCYHISGYQANARCLVKSVERQYLEDASNELSYTSPDAILTRLFRRGLVSFLNRDIKNLWIGSAIASAKARSLQEPIAQGIANGDFSKDDIILLTAHAYYQQALFDFTQYCITGERQNFQASRSNMEKSHAYFQKIGETTFGTITSEIRTVLDLFDERSTWSNISHYAGDLAKTPLWQTYLRNLAFQQSIVELWQSQLKAVERGLLTSKEGFVVQMPTSSGKTFIAELSILSALTFDSQARCLYIAPYRALVNEIEDSLADTLGGIGIRVSNLAGGFEFDAFQDFLAASADVLVTTPEKVDLLLRTHPEYFDRVNAIVIDEGHIVDEGVPIPGDLGDGETLSDWLNQRGTLGRGPLLELLISRIKNKFPSIRFIFLSAVMPEINATDFVEWLTGKKEESLRISQDERPSRQIISRFHWKSAENGEIEYVSLPKLPHEERSPFVPYFMRREQYLTGDSTPTGRPQRSSWPDITSKTQTTAMLAVRFAKAGPVLVFCAQQSHVRNVVTNILTSLAYLEASDKLSDSKMKYIENPNIESYQLAKEWLGDDHILTQALHRGIGLHYGPLPEPVRQAIENDYRNDKLHILVSTNTLGQGVNLPIKTAIIYGLERTWGEEQEGGLQQLRQEKVKKRDFWNICGRAGRAGKETEGHIVFVVISQRDNVILEEFRDVNNVEEVDSGLYKILRALVENRIGQQDLIGLLDTHILAMLAEEVADAEDEESLKHFLAKSLVGVQAARNGIDLQPLVSAFKGTAAWVSTEVPQEIRRVFSSTGLRVKSCQILEREAALYAQALTKDKVNSLQNDLHVDESLLHAAFAACRDLPEMRMERNLRDHYHGPEDEFDLVRDWVAARPISDIRTKYWASGNSESLTEYLADRLVYKLPWGMNGFLRILSQKLGMEYVELPLAWQHLPSMVKFGLNDVVAAWACSLGISSRNLALKLSDKYTKAHSESFLDFIKWIVELPTEYIINELTATEFEKTQLLNTRNRIIPDNGNLDFIRNGRKEIVCSIQGIQYKNRNMVASQVRKGDQLLLELDTDNRYDPHAVRVIFDGQEIGFIPRSQSRIVSREIALKKPVSVYASAVNPPDENNPMSSLELSIKFG